MYINIEDDSDKTEIDWETDGLDMNKQEYIFNFHVWHENLAHALYPQLYGIKNGKKTKNQLCNS